jgi:hypothetical protein
VRPLRGENAGASADEVPSGETDETDDGDVPDAGTAAGVAGVLISADRYDLTEP